MSLSTILNPSTTATSIPLHNNTSISKTTTAIYSTESNDPLFTTSNTPHPSTTQHTSAAPTTTTDGGANNGGDYGSYSYPSPTIPGTTSHTATGPSTARGSSVSSVVSVEPIGGTTSGITGPGTGLQPTLTVTRTTFFTETRASLTTTASVSDGYGEGYDGYY